MHAQLQSPYNFTDIETQGCLSGQPCFFEKILY